MLNRRKLLLSMAAGAAGAATFPLPALAAKSTRRLPWKNWSGSQECLPAARKAPASVAELQELITSSTGTIRPVGAGHSFTALVPTDDTIVSLSRLSGLVDHDPDSLQATLWAGTRLGDIGEPLNAVGQAMINMPDIDEQALAGCLGTATHGTGREFGCIPTFVQSLQLVDAQGNVIDCDRDNNPEVFNATLVSLGATGVITQITLQNQAPYYLREEIEYDTIDNILDRADEIARNHRNFEFYFIPFSGMGFTVTHDITDEKPSQTAAIDQNDGAETLKDVRDYLEWSPFLRELVLGGYMGTLDKEVSIEPSWKNYASERNVRFNEMEYHLPAEHGVQALREIREVLESQHHEVFFPIEFRYVKADDIWLSPFNGRDTCSIAVHRYFEEDYKPYFKNIEPIFRKYNGRPHWGKLNTLSREDFRELYPQWDEFAAVRKELDPQGRFLNPYLKSLFG